MVGVFLLMVRGGDGGMGVYGCGVLSGGVVGGLVGR